MNKKEIEQIQDEKLRIDILEDLRRQDLDPPPMNEYVVEKIKEVCPDELWKLEQQGIDHWENTINKQ